MKKSLTPEREKFRKWYLEEKDKGLEYISISLSFSAMNKLVEAETEEELRDFLEEIAQHLNVMNNQIALGNFEEYEYCPDCNRLSVRAKGLNEGGGVECINPDCEYWFCF